jgi:hypothetical protein
MTEFYPGSRKQRKSYEEPEKLVPQDEAEDFDLGKPKIFLVNGQPAELFTLGVVARALNRQPVTVRKWESEGIIPRSPFVLPSHDPRGQRRLYTRAQIEALRTVAEEEGVLSPNANGKWKSIETTSFREKAIRAFKGAQ